MDEKRCVICEAYFRANAMVGDKCVKCKSLYPNAKTKEDVRVKNKNKAEILLLIVKFLKIIRFVIKDANVFVISHKESLFDKFENLIKFEKHKGFSRIV